ncbi:LON peptidase N-terminal domain and RING finger protein 3-like isoform X2 [Lineus longissimus]|uniref:LON peptidase N-terminal domain and RING finger protein 3-like isoform X2 n=1 Tax=Lineus longissimus TaxID=88925 RepID=UPI00315C9622
MAETLELAKEAFATRNFDLAAEIYERRLTSGPDMKIYLALGDCYSKTGDFKKAFHAYTQAYKLGRVKPDQLKHLVDGLVDFMSTKGVELSLVPKMEHLDMFSCWTCRSLLVDPIVLPCGHVFCRKCLEKDGTKTCKKCKVVHYHLDLKKAKTNVVISGILDKLFFPEVNAVRLKTEGNKHFEERNFPNAITSYSKALEFAPNDHLLVSNRSHAYASLERYHEALADADIIIKLRPDWPKAYYRRGAALSGLNRHEEACLAFLQCLALDPMIATAKTALAKELHAILSPIEAGNLKQVELEQLMNPSPWMQLFSQREEHHLSAERIMRVKVMLKDTLVKAGMAEQNEPNAVKVTDLNVDSQQRCMSAPTSRSPSPHSSPCLSRRSASLAEDELVEGRTGSGRKRARECESDESHTESLIRSVQNKLARSLAEKKADDDKTSSVKNSEAPADVKETGRKPNVSLLSQDDIECSICSRLYYMPVGTACGHIFCRQCLDRCLDHSNFCPLCKSSLAEHLAERRQSVVETIEELITTYFSDQWQERKKSFEEEMSVLVNGGKDDQHEIPIFVCSLAYPTVACPLHVFEPRYRLMIRQSMESGTRKFGMCTATGNSEGEFADIGTMLEIRDVQYFADGRSIVDTIGGQRFRVISRGVREGYNTAKVRFMEDDPVAANDRDEVLAISKEVYDQSREWFQGLSMQQQTQITSHFGTFPRYDSENPLPPIGPNWAWWVTAILPLDPRAQVSIIRMTNLKERLVALKNVIQFLNRQRNK